MTNEYMLPKPVSTDEKYYGIVDNYYMSQCKKCKVNKDKKYIDPHPEDPEALTVMFCSIRCINMMRFPTKNCEHFR